MTDIPYREIQGCKFRAGHQLGGPVIWQQQMPCLPRVIHSSMFRKTQMLNITYAVIRIVICPVYMEVQHVQ